MPELLVQSRNAMGTVFAIYLYAQDAQQAEALFETAFDEVERLEDQNYVACSSFIDSIRKNRRPLADERVALAEGVAVALGNQAIEQGKRIMFPEDLRQQL